MAWRAPLTEFRSQQAIHDLAHIAGEADAAVLAAAFKHSKTLREIIATRRCRLEPNDEPVIRDLLLAAATPERPEPFITATCVLLANTLQSGHQAEALTWFWEEYHAAYRVLPTRERGAILRGWLRVQDVTGLTLDPMPDPVEFVGNDPNSLIPGLRDLAKGMTDDLVAYVAKADYGRDVDQHYAALRRLIWDQDCELHDDQNWFPAEVVELISHVPSQPGFIECTALLLIDAIRGRDNIGRMEFRWQNNAPAYRALPEPIRRLFLKSFRYVYESDPEFLSFDSKDYEKLGADYLIPMF